MTIDLSAANAAEDTIPIPAMRPTKDQAIALAEIKRRLRPNGPLGPFYQEVIGHGIVAIAHAKAPPDVSAACDAAKLAADLDAEVAALRVHVPSSAVAEIDAMRAELAAAKEEIRGLNKECSAAAATISNLSTANMGRDDMIRVALVGVEAHARKGSRARMALDALEAIRVAIGAPDLATAIADAAMYRESRLATLASHRENGPANPRKAKATTDDSEAT